MLCVQHNNDNIGNTNEYIEHTNELQAANLNKNYLNVVVGFWKRSLLSNSSPKHSDNSRVARTAVSF